MTTINDLPSYVAELPDAYKKLWDRLLRLDVTTGSVVPPERMHAWIERSFGSVATVLKQQVLRVTNLWSLEGAIFNTVRSQRPQQGRYSSNIDQIIAANAGANDSSGFATPESGTPEDVFGRLRGRYCITASNIAKYDGWHGVLVFDQHHPLNFNLERIEDYLQTAQRWFNMVHSVDPEALFPFFIWNCLWRSGASVIHGHAQMSVARAMPYPKIEILRRAATNYETTHKSSYFSDLWKLHRHLGLAFGSLKSPIQAYVSLTPIKEKEVVLIGQDFPSLAHHLYHVLDCFVTELGVQSFNVSIVPPPLSPATPWPLPVILRVVDRGDPNSRGSDIGGMELYAAPVISTDPFLVARALAGRFSGDA